MTRRRHVLLKAAVVALLGAVNLSAPDRAEAARAMLCEADFCGDMSECQESLCFFCDHGYGTICEFNQDCWDEEGTQGPFRIYCGYVE